MWLTLSVKSTKPATGVSPTCQTTCSFASCWTSVPRYRVNCTTGYTGRLYTVCAAAYSWYGRAFCSQCGSKGFSITQGVLIFLEVFPGVQNLFEFERGPEEEVGLEYAVRILINFAQVMMLMNNFQIVWPSVLTTYFDGLYVSGNSSQMTFSDFDDCDACCDHRDFSLLLGDRECHQAELDVCDSTQHLHDVGPAPDSASNDLQTAGQMLTCKDMEKGTSWLVGDMTIQWWIEEHLMYTTMMPVPVLAFWCIGIPLAFYLSLVSNRKCLGDSRFAFIYSGYQRESYYCEFVMVVLKSYSHLLSTYNIDVQSNIRFLSLAFFLLIHNIKKPFSSVKLKQMETYSLIASISTLICGMMYDTDLGTNEVTSSIMVAVVLLINGNFLYRCLSGVLGRLREVIVAKYRRPGHVCTSIGRRSTVSRIMEKSESREGSVTRRVRTNRSECF